MHNIISHEGHVNQNHNEISLHTHQDDYNKKNDNNKNWQEWGETENLIHCWQKCKNGAAILENCVTVLQNVRHRYTSWPSNSLLGLPKRNKACVGTKTWTQIVIHHSLRWKQPIYLSTEKWINYGISTQWGISQQCKWTDCQTLC